MDTSDTLHDLDELIRSRSILRHPFYVAWQRGELTRGQLATYAKLYWPHVAAFPGYLESVIEQTDDPLVRRDLEENLSDERSRPKAHPELWLDFAEELGLTREDVRGVPPHAAAKRMVKTFTRLAHSGAADGITALYAYEVQQPEVSRQKQEGLRCHYGVQSRKALAYFKVHAEADVAHSRGERESLARCLDAGASHSAVVGAATDALDAYWGLLDGICVEAGIASA